MKGMTRKDKFKTPLSIFKAIGDDNRIRIVERLRKSDASAHKLMDDLHITQPTLSHHMKILGEAGLVVGRRRGRCTHYSLLSEGMDMLMGYLAQLKVSMTRAAGADAEAG